MGQEQTRPRRRPNPAQRRFLTDPASSPPASRPTRRRFDREDSSLLKAVIISAESCGKTTILDKFADSTTELAASGGYDFAEYRSRFNDAPYTLQIWDFSHVAKTDQRFFRAMNAVIFVFDVTNPETFQLVQEMHGDMLQTVWPGQSADTIPMIVIGNMTDKADRKVMRQEVEDWCSGVRILRAPAKYRMMSLPRPFAPSTTTTDSSAVAVETPETLPKRSGYFEFSALNDADLSAPFQHLLEEIVIRVPIHTSDLQHQQANDLKQALQGAQMLSEPRYTKMDTTASDNDSVLSDSTMRPPPLPKTYVQTQHLTGVEQVVTTVSFADAAGTLPEDVATVNAVRTYESMRQYKLNSPELHTARSEPVQLNDPVFGYAVPAKVAVNGDIRVNALRLLDEAVSKQPVRAMFVPQRPLVRLSEGPFNVAEDHKDAVEM